MPSSPTPLPACPVPRDIPGGDELARVGGLLEILAGVPDPRARRGVRHRVVSVLAISVAAVLAGARAYTVIAEWAGEQPTQVLATLGVTGRVPSEATIRRVLAAVDAAILAAAVGAFVWTRSTVSAAIAGSETRSMTGLDGPRVTRVSDEQRCDFAPRWMPQEPHQVSGFRGPITQNAV